MEEARWEKARKNGAKSEKWSLGTDLENVIKGPRIPEFQFSTSVIITILPSNFRKYTLVHLRTAELQHPFLLIFWPFWHQFGPKLKPNHWPNFHLILIEELGLENLSFGGWVLTKTLVPSIPFILFSSLLIPFLQSSTFLPLPCLNKVPPCSWSWWEVAWAMVLQRGVPIPFLSLYIFDCLGLG